MRASIMRPQVNLKTIALPTSHGGWGFLLEPILLGLLLAPSAAGLWLAVSALGAFLAQQPLKLALSDRQKRRRYPRSVWAERIAAFYIGAAALGLMAALFTAGHTFWLALVLAAPLALVQLYYDAKNRGREFIPELFGAGALGAVASAVVLAGGWPVGVALALWAILLARALGSIVYVRARLRLERRQAINKTRVWTAHGLGLVVVGALAIFGVAPWLAVLALAILLMRALAGLSAYRQPVVAKTVGFQEMGYGLLTVVLTAVGYIFGL